MATYNGEKFLIEQLTSLGEQTVLPDEVIIRGNGPADNILTLINPFKEILPCNIRGYFNKTLYMEIKVKS